MNILYCIPHLYNAGGMERVLSQKVNWLASHTTHRLTILTTESAPEGKTAVHYPLDPRVTVVSLAIDFDADYAKPLLSKWVGHMRRMKQYRKVLTDYIQREQIDLCISLCGKEIAFLRYLPCRTIAEVHFALDQRRQLLMANHKGWVWSLLGRIRTWQLVQAVKPLEQLVVLTESDQKDWQKAGCTHTTVIPNPCSLDGQKIPMESKKKILLSVGRLHEQKGYDLLLDAWCTLEPQFPEWSLRIVGEGPKRAALEAQIDRLGLRHVSMIGQTNHVAAEYGLASLFVLSSRYEGLPLALIEAMWCGLPCVAFDCPQGPAELLAADRGWLVPNGDVEKLTAQLAYIFAHTEEEALSRAAKAQTYAQTTYSESAIMPKWLTIIHRQ